MKELFKRYPSLKGIENDISKALSTLIDCYENDGKLLLCGNGGSCADCDHISGELMKGFLLSRKLSAEQMAAMKANCPELEDDTLSLLQNGLPAIPLASFTALNSAVCNDNDPNLVYAQALLSLADSNDVLLAISTSGNAKNVVLAARVAKSLGLKVIGLSGRCGGTLRQIADVCICAPEDETYKIQELHLPIYHALCAEIEKHFFG
jgi:D-sedoheptulose 7-phosphate isomerase